MRRLEQSHDNVIGYSLAADVTEDDERLQFVREHRDDIERVAIVTDDTGAEMLAEASETVGPDEMETYSFEQEPKAWAWLA